MYNTFNVKAIQPCNLADFAVDMAIDDTIDLIADGYDLNYISSSDELFELLDDGTLELILDPNDLAIKPYIRPNQPIKSTDFTLLDLLPEPWVYSRGARKVREYKGKNEEIIIRDAYEYDYIDEGRIVNGFNRTIFWLTAEGEVGQTKDTSGIINKKRLKQLNRDLRQGRIDYLEASAEELRDVAGFVPEPYKTQYNTVADSIDLLFSHYSVQVTDYISRGTRTFETMVLNETNPQILAIHAIPTSPPSPAFPNGLTVRSSILYQIRGWIDEFGDTPGF